MTPATLTALIDATWPAKSICEVDGWMIRSGAGGGSRVSAATALAGTSLDTHGCAKEAMKALGQTPVFMVRTGEEALDRALAEAGYAIKDPVTYYTAPIATLTTQRPPPVTSFEVWPPLAAQVEIWAAGGIDDARLAIMHRAKGPKTTVLGRTDDSPAGTAFAAITGDTAMLHGIETAQDFRRKGVARTMITALAFWAQDHGAQTITLLVTRANIGANALYTSMGFSASGGYHYRILTSEPS